MKNLGLILFIALILASLLPPTEGTSGSRPLDITTLTIKFDKTDAEFTINYDLGTMPKMYILLLGGKSIQPRIKEVFSNFDYEILKIDQEKALLKVKNISRIEKGYYLHNSVKLGATINTIIIYIPGDPQPTEYFGLNETKNTFYRQ
jgi:hypothetical protein